MLIINAFASTRYHPRTGVERKTKVAVVKKSTPKHTCALIQSEFGALCPSGAMARLISRSLLKK